MIQAAIIGVSGYGAQIYSLCKEQIDAGRMTMAAAVIRTPAKVPEVVAELDSMGCQIFSTAEELFSAMKGKLDLVFIPTGIETHMPFTLAALEAGANVLVEKPVAGTLAEVEAMAEAEKRTGLTVAVGFQDIYRTDIHEIKRRLLAGEWGGIESITIHGRWPRAKSYYARNSWAGHITSGGATVYDSPANNALAHYMNLGLFLAGTSFESSANINSIEADLYRAYPIESFDTIATRAVADNGVRFHYTVTHATMDNQDPIVTVNTEKARVILERDRSRVEHLTGELLEEINHVGTEKGRHNMIPSVIDAIEGKESFICSLAIGRAHTAFINQLHAEHEIKNVPAEQIEEITKGKEEHLCVIGLAEAMQEATATCSLLSELGLAWTKK